VRRRTQRTDRDARARRLVVTSWPRVARVLLPLLAALALHPSPAAASRQQLAMFEDDRALQSQPEATLDTLRLLGVGIVRVYVPWARIAPRPSATHRPAGFNPSNPAAYPAANWSIYDRIVRDAHERGIQVDLTLSSPAPLWANGADIPPQLLRQWKAGPPQYSVDQWKPLPREYGAFVRAIAKRYSGTFRPAAASAPLPRVSFWALWNEPNFGADLAPQAIQRSSTLASPMLYRGLLDAGWSALRAVGHGRDTILIGSLAARGNDSPPGPGAPDGLPGTFGMTKPMHFIRSLYCVDARYRQLRGPAARAVGCPVSAAASRGFRRAHPGLFAASGFADHPYPINLPPDRATANDPDYTEYSQLPRLTAALDRLQRLYRSPTRLQLFITEYGYITNPPNHSINHFASPPTAAYYLNWAEYLSWRNPRIATTMQYLLADPNPRRNVPEFGGFASGLEFYGGVHKPSFDAYRLPLYLPITSTRPGEALEVWGAARPARYAAIDSGQPQTVQIQFAQGSSRTFDTVDTVSISDPRAYFDARVAFPSSGSVRLSWTYPMGGPTVLSRTQRITVSSS
jgi:hypothetical protein